jgi:hypothetical protein
MRHLQTLRSVQKPDIAAQCLAPSDHARFQKAPWLKLGVLSLNLPRPNDSASPLEIETR